MTTLSAENPTPPDACPDNQAVIEELLWSIAMGQGEFSLLLIRCNYGRLRESLLAELTARIEDGALGDLSRGPSSAQVNQRPPSLAVLTLDKRTVSLYQAIAAFLEERPEDGLPAAIALQGLESLDQLDDVLSRANVGRDAFGKNIKTPMLWWVDDQVLRQMGQRMPDFRSWASTTYRFELTTPELLEELRGHGDRRLSACLNQPRFVAQEEVFSPQELREHGFAIEEAQRRELTLRPELLACGRFEQGCVAYAEGHIEAALQHYRASLEQWQDQEDWINTGIAHFYLSLCHAQQQQWEQAKVSRQKCLDTFTAAQRQDLVAKFVGSMGEVWVALEEWPTLEQEAKTWQGLHGDDPVNLAQDWSLLAEVARQRQQWGEMQRCAELALDILATAGPSLAQTTLLRYVLQRVEALTEQGLVEGAIAFLEEMRRQVAPKQDPEGYIELLQVLRDLYYRERRYKAAFEIKQLRQALQYRFKQRAFLGAGKFTAQLFESSPEELASTLVASGRQGDIHELVDVRMSEDRYKLTVLCGPSGVGKSSLTEAGLVPAVRGRSFKTYEGLPVVVRVYSDWVGELGKALTVALEEHPEVLLAFGNTPPQPSPYKGEGAEQAAQPPPPPVSPLTKGGLRGVMQTSQLTTIDTITAQLQRNGEQRFLTVLIFDQFEEFFFNCETPKQRQAFYGFLKACIEGKEVPFVKVILSLREDYLHELLEFEAFLAQTSPEFLTPDFLSRDQRWRIENFTPGVARSVIESLSGRTTLRLEEALVERLVRDLTNELGRVRPVELQVVGAQLEAEGIASLEQYRQLGDNPKEQLAEEWIGAVVKDCGVENEAAAWQILTALTDEQGTRPLLTLTELAEVLADYQRLAGAKAGSLDGDILPILTDSGLVVQWPQEPEDRYQLVHDYLVEPIRQRYNRDYRQRLEQLFQDKEEAEKQRKRLQTQVLKGSVVVACGFAVLAGVAGWYAIQSNRSERLAVARQLIAQSDRMSALRPNLRPAAALLTMEAFHRLNRLGKNTIEADDSLRRWLESLPTVVKRIEHTAPVRSVSFSADSQYLATSSNDGTAKLIEVSSGREVKTIEHTAPVWSVSFSADSQYLATRSNDGTAKLIEVSSGREVKTIEHTDSVGSVSFSADSQYLATR
ncbi:MAG: hypothetical protein AAGD25_35000, partial [Cyanobacteria bacterium P01_F01_bin.150]